jgi:hypothetical protein
VFAEFHDAVTQISSVTSFLGAARFLRDFDYYLVEPFFFRQDECISAKKWFFKKTG